MSLLLVFPKAEILCHFRIAYSSTTQPTWSLSAPPTSCLFSMLFWHSWACTIHNEVIRGWRYHLVCKQLEACPCLLLLSQFLLRAKHIVVDIWKCSRLIFYGIGYIWDHRKNTNKTSHLECSYFQIRFTSNISSTFHKHLGTWCNRIFTWYRRHRDT